LMKKIVLAEKIVPVMCQLMTVEGMQQNEQMTISPEHVTALTNAMHAALGKLTASEKTEVVTSAFNSAEAILRGENSGTWRQLLLKASMFVCKMVAEGLPQVDPQSQPVLIGLALLEEAQHDDTGEWGFDKSQLEEAAGRMLSRARLLGLFLGKPLDS
jgi:hypothetical protein